MVDYKNTFRKQLEAAKDKREKSINLFFDESKPVNERLIAFKNFGTFNEVENVQKALKLFRDESQNEDLRAAALEGLINEVSTNENLIDELIAILDSGLTVKLRRVILTVLQASSFSSTIFPSKRPSYFKALREVINDDDKILKQMAMEQLAMNSDNYLQEKLIEGLNDPKKEITRPEVAIQLLSYDLHANHYPVLRKIAKNPPNLRTKKEALRNLAADPDSKNLLLETLQDSKEDPEIRHVCAVALESLSPKDVQSYAKRMLLDNKENEELKAAMLNTLTYSGATEALTDEEFNKNLEDTQNQVSSPNLKKMYSEFKFATEKRKNKN